MNSSPSHAEANAQVHSIQGWRSLLAWPLAALMKVWGWTLRLEVDEASLAAYRKTDEPLAVVVWHNRLFMVAEIRRRYRPQRPVYALVSASKDGAWLEVFFSLVGIRCVRGSSSRLGREAASSLIAVLQRGDDIGITPDGPRGPVYEVKGGGLIVTRRTHAPMLVVGCQFQRSWRFRSWDRFNLPLPFSRVIMRARLVRSEALPQDRNEAAKVLQSLLLEMNPDTPPKNPI